MNSEELYTDFLIAWPPGVYQAVAHPYPDWAYGVLLEIRNKQWRRFDPLYLHWSEWGMIDATLQTEMTMRKIS